jgi:hypothetical protein
MAEATKIIQTLDDAVQAYRGEDRFCKAFEISAGTLKRWRGIGVPRTHALGLYLGLRARDCDIRPQLFGVKNWADIPGVKF